MNLDLEVKKTIAIYLVGIGRGGIPNSHLWLAVDSQMEDLDRHQAILGMLKSAGLVVEKFNFLTLTEKGVRMLGEITELYVSVKEKSS